MPMLKVKVGREYRQLKPHELLREGDEVWCDDDWVKVCTRYCNKQISTAHYRRRKRSASFKIRDMSAGADYRELMPDEMIEHDDEYMNVNDLTWHRVKRGGQRVRSMVLLDITWKYRRRLAPPMQVDIEYRRLIYGDVIRDGDEVWSLRRNKWIKSACVGQPILITKPEQHCTTYRRLIKS